MQEYVSSKSEIELVRCCIPNFRTKENTDRIKDEIARTGWSRLPQSASFSSEDTIYSICPNCTNILSEQYEGIRTISLWEFIDQDKDFVFPDYHGIKATIQDCWRTREQRAEQDAVRSLLAKMNIDVVELTDNYEKTEFCGSTLYREQPAKNALYAPKHYVEQAAGKFQPHSEEEQIRIMKEYCSRYTTDIVVCYCHYCLEGLIQGGVDGRHIAHLLFA